MNEHDTEIYYRGYMEAISEMRSHTEWLAQNIREELRNEAEKQKRS